MTAYIVFTRDETTDAAELALYSQAVGKTFDGHQVEFLATYGEIETLEGDAVEAAVILRFPDMQAARAWPQRRLPDRGAASLQGREIPGLPDRGAERSLIADRPESMPPSASNKESTDVIT